MRGRGGRLAFCRAALKHGDHLVAWSVSHEPTFVEEQQTIDEAQQRKPVCRYDDGYIPGRQQLEPFDKFAFAAHVKMRRRLVEKQYSGLPDQHARKSDGLLLTAG